jgi:hypothetical protein
MTTESEKYPSRWPCRHALVGYWPEFCEYDLIVDDGGESTVIMTHCPWYGSRLPDRG